MITVRKIQIYTLSSFLFCTFLCFFSLTPYPLRLTKMFRSRDLATIVLISDIHAEDKIKNIRALDNHINAYLNLLIQLNKITPVSLICEHSKKIYLAPGDNFDVYDKKDRSIFIDQIKPKIEIEKCINTMRLAPCASNLFRSFYNIFTNDNKIFGKNLSEQPRIFMDRLAMLLRVKSDIHLIASDEERNSMLSYTLLNTFIQEILDQLCAFSDAPSQWDKQAFEDLKSNIRAFLINSFILINKILLSETVPDKILANNVTLLQQDINDLNNMWAAYKNELNHFYMHDYYQLVKTFFVDIEDENECIISICKQLPNLHKVKDLIKDSMIEYELLFNTFASPTNKKIIYAGYFHCSNIIHNLERLGFAKVEDIGEQIDTNKITDDLFAYDINSKAPTYILEEKTMFRFKKELDLSRIQHSLTK